MLGTVDDAVVILWAIKTLVDETDRFLAWEAGEGLGGSPRTIRRGLVDRRLDRSADGTGGERGVVGPAARARIAGRPPASGAGPRLGLDAGAGCDELRARDGPQATGAVTRCVRCPHPQTRVERRPQDRGSRCRAIWTVSVGACRRSQSPDRPSWSPSSRSTSGSNLSEVSSSSVSGTEPSASSPGSMSSAAGTRRRQRAVTETIRRDSPTAVALSRTSRPGEGAPRRLARSRSGAGRHSRDRRPRGSRSAWYCLKVDGRGRRPGPPSTRRRARCRRLRGPRSSRSRRPRGDGVPRPTAPRRGRSVGEAIEQWRRTDAVCTALRWVEPRAHFRACSPSDSVGCPRG